MNTTMEYEILAVITLAVITCSIPGLFIVLRKNYYSTDTANRASVLGIGVMFGIAGGLSSPVVALGGAVSSAVAIIISDKIAEHTKFRKKGVSLIVGSAFLSAGIFSAVKFSGKVEFDLSTIYMGETAFTYFNRVRVFGLDIGSYTIYSILAVFLINISLAVIFYRKFKVEGVDREYSLLLGIRPRLLDFILMLMVSLSVSVSYQSAGIFMTTAFLLIPPSIAYFWTKRFYLMVILTFLTGIISCYFGFKFAWNRELSVSGSIALLMGILFIISVLFGPFGIIRKLVFNRKYRKKLEEFIFMDILLNRNINELDGDLFVKKVSSSLNWNEVKTNKVITALKNRELLKMEKNMPVLTEKGIFETNKFVSSQSCFE